MPTIASELELLQADIGKKLESESYFNDIPVFVVRNQTMEADIANAIMGTSFKNNKTGVAVQVLMPTADCVAEYEKVPGPFLTVTYTVRVQEYPIMNMGSRGTGKTAEQIALNILSFLHLFNFGRSLADFRASPNALTPSLDFAPRLTYDCQFHAAYQLPVAALNRVATPTASLSGTTLTLSCTDVATMFYTTDDALYPSAGGGGTLYVNPIQVLVGQTIRAAAYKTGLQSSEVLRLDIEA